MILEGTSVPVAPIEILAGDHVFIRVGSNGKNEITHIERDGKLVFEKPDDDQPNTHGDG